MCWFKISVDRGNWSAIFYRGVTSGDGELPMFGISPSRNLHLYNGVDTSGSVLAVGTWYHVCVVRNSSTDWKFYLNGVQDGSVTSETAVTIGRMNIGCDGPYYTSFGINGVVDSVKLYSTNLSVAEIQNEIWSKTPRRTLNLVSWLPCVDATLANNYLDQSGNGANWTLAAGTPTIEDGSPTIWRRGPSRIFIPAAAASSFQPAWCGNFSQLVNNA